MKMTQLMKLMVAIGISALVMTGCSNKELHVDNKVKNEQMVSELEGAPKWVMSYGDDDDKVYGVGIAEPTHGDISFQRAMAMGAARDEIARNISSKVKNMLKSYKEKTGVTDDDGTYDKVATDVSKQVANETLRGSVAEDWWISKSGNLYILVSMPKENIKETVYEKTKSSFKNNKAMWQKFQAKQAQDELKAEIDSEF
jgi:hypothetical protein